MGKHKKVEQRSSFSQTPLPDSAITIRTTLKVNSVDCGTDTDDLPENDRPSAAASTDLPEFFLLKLVQAKSKKGIGIQVKTPESNTPWPDVCSSISKKIGDDKYDHKDSEHKLIMSWTNTKTGTPIEVKNTEDLRDWLKLNKQSELNLYRGWQWDQVIAGDGMDKLTIRQLVNLHDDLGAQLEKNRTQRKEIKEMISKTADLLTKLGYKFPISKNNPGPFKKFSISFFGRKSSSNAEQLGSSRASSVSSMACSSGTEPRDRKKVDFDILNVGTSPKKGK